MKVPSLPCRLDKVSMVLIVLSIFWSQALKSQSKVSEEGRPYVQNYEPSDYNAESQNWFITQDQNGLIYVANGKGVLEFDGVTWRLIPLPSNNVARSVVVDKHNTKWIAAEQEMGYLERDSLGFYQYVSLKEHIPSSHPLNAIVWDVLTLEDEVLFNGRKTIYLWKDDTIVPIDPKGKVLAGFKVGEKAFFLINNGDKAIIKDTYQVYEWRQNKLQPLPGGSIPKGMNLLSLLPRGEQLLLGTMDKGLFLYDGTSVHKFKNEIDQYLMENRLYSGTALLDGSYAFATLKGGIILMDKEGKRLKTITDKDGILSDQVYHIFPDRSGGLWLALSKGISRVEPSLPFSFFNQRSGLKGRVQQVVRHKGKLYVGTLRGLYVLEKGLGEGPYKFNEVNGIKGSCFSLLSVGKHLIVATGVDGIVEVHDENAKKIVKLDGFTLYRSKKNPSRVFVGHAEGVSSMYLNDGQWQFEGNIDGITRSVRSIAEDADGTLWLGTQPGGVVNISFSSYDKGIVTKKDSLKKTYFGEEEGLPKGGWAYVYTIENDVFVRPDNKKDALFKFDPARNRFDRYREFWKRLGTDSTKVFLLQQQEENLLIVTKKTKGEGGFSWFSVSHNETDYVAKSLQKERFEHLVDPKKVFWDGKDILWLGGKELVRYDLKAKLPTNPSFKTFVRQVSIGQDSVVFGGIHTPEYKLTLAYRDNGLRFQYAAPSFEDYSDNQYRVQLMGFDKDWSSWTAETQRDYTNIPEGSYQFKVQAKNIYGKLGEVGTFHFSVLPPWYRSWWAHTLYALIAVLFIYGIVSLRSRKLKRDKRRLEGIIEEKTAAIQDQAERLKDLDKAKSRFFANISHEFRTPLTLILGPMERMMQQQSLEGSEELPVMYRNTKRMERLIDQLLDLSKIESSTLQLGVVSSDVIAFLRPLVSSFSSHAEERNIDYITNFSPDSRAGYFDPDKLEKVVYNLLSNALKFTPEGGKVQVHVQADATELKIAVADTGQGIEKGELPHIFERFHRTTQAQKRQQEGTGIGLALTKELVELHHGEIQVESTLEEGSNFTVTLPLAKGEYADSEMGTDLSHITVQKFPSQTPTEPLSQDDPQGVERPSLLIVEDNQDLIRYISKGLGRDFHVLEAQDGEEGIAMALEHIPDIIVSDLMMPKKDGIELCGALKADERTEHIPIVLLTAKADVKSRLEGLGTGADDYLTKPFNMEELSIRVQNLIAQRKLLRERYSRMIVLKPQDIDITSKDEVFLTKAMGIVEQQMEDPEFSVEKFQSAIGMSRMQLHRKLKALTGHSTMEFIKVQRLTQAVSLLRKDWGSVSEVCYAVGFANLSHFTTSFKKQYGVPPSEYAKIEAEES